MINFSRLYGPKILFLGRYSWVDFGYRLHFRYAGFPVAGHELQVLELQHRNTKKVVTLALLLSRLAPSRSSIIFHFSIFYSKTLYHQRFPVPTPAPSPMVGEGGGEGK